MKKVVVAIGLVACSKPAASIPEPVTPKLAAIAPVVAPDAPMVDAPGDSPEEVPTEKGPEPIVIKKGTRVLMFGDSMVTSGLGVTLQDRVEAAGGKWFHISKPSSTSATWSAENGKAVRELVLRARPDVILVVLSSNELFVPNPGARAPDIRQIVSRVSSKPCVWIGPSPWLPEKGMLGVVQANVSPCRYFDSTQLDIEKGKDGIHPSMAGGKTWADAVWSGVFRSE